MDSMHKLQRVNRAIEDQKRFISRVPDPDNRSLAEINLATLIELRDRLEDQLAHGEVVGGGTFESDQPTVLH